MPLTYNKDELRAKGEVYCQNNNTSITKQLGFGTQGVVFKTERNSAIKVHSLEKGYVRERNVYVRLYERGIQDIRGFAIPRILQWADNLLTFEMSIVHVPCILDFGGAYVDEQPEHVKREDDWFEKMQEEFHGNWNEAQEIIKELEREADICLSDVNTGNIKFPEVV